MSNTTVLSDSELFVYTITQPKGLSTSDMKEGFIVDLFSQI